MHLYDIQRQAWHTAHDKGLHDHLDTLPLREATLIRLALVHTEVSEAAQEVKRRGVTPENAAAIGEELADTVIRLADLAETLGLNLEYAVAQKLVKNTTRARLYGTPWEEEGYAPTPA